MTPTGSDHREWELLTRHIDEGFARLDRTLDTLRAETAESNRLLAVHEARIVTAEDWIKTLRERSHAVSNLLQRQERRLLVRDISIIAFTISAFAAIVKWGRSWLGIP